MDTMASPSVPELMLHLLPPVEEMLKVVPSSGIVAYFARHAQPHDYTIGTRLKKVYGTHARQVWLSDVGIEQAMLARDYACDHIGRVGTVVCSTLPRAIQTARIITGYYIVKPPPFIEDARLEDIRLGPWLDVPRKDWDENRELYWHEQLESLGLEAGGPENPYQTQQRMVESIFEYIRQHSGERPLLFVSHGDPLSFFFQYLEGAPIMNLVGYRSCRDVGKCTIWQVRLFPDRPVEISEMFRPPK